MNVQRAAAIYTAVFAQADRVNPRVREGFARHSEDPDSRRNHWLGGRFENVYIDPAKIPKVRELLAFALACAREILAHPPAELRAGFWFIEMRPGHATLPHTHDDGDELLSGVYYLRVPAHSGDLVILEGHLRTVVQPREGLAVFFSPDVLHEVTPNRSNENRLSLAFNIGPA
jgi:hypothetical protein